MITSFTRHVIKMWTGQSNRECSCWGATMHAVGATPRMFYVDGHDASAWLGNHCWQLDSAKHARPGDVLALGTLEYPIHFALVLNRDTFWHQDGFRGGVEVIDSVRLGDKYPSFYSKAVTFWRPHALAPQFRFCACRSYLSRHYHYVCD